MSPDNPYKTLLGEELLIPNEVAACLDIPKTTLYDWAQRGKIPAFKVGKHWRFKRSKLEAWLAQRPRHGRKRSASRTLTGPLRVPATFPAGDPNQDVGTVPSTSPPAPPTP